MSERQRKVFVILLSEFLRANGHDWLGAPTGEQIEEAWDVFSELEAGSCS
jgi:hypothetical protein